VDTKKGKNCFSPTFCCCVVGPGIRDPGSGLEKNPDRLRQVMLVSVLKDSLKISSRSYVTSTFLDMFAVYIVFPVQNPAICYTLIH
jgi:hypothetical protein